MSLFKKLLKKAQVKLPMPGGTTGKYAKFGKIGAALALGPALGPVNPASMDPEVLGARGSASRPGASVDRAKEYKIDETNAGIAANTAAAAAATEASAQEQAQLVQRSQLAARRRNKRFAYGYDRASGGGDLGGTGGAAGDQKTLLGY